MERLNLVIFGCSLLFLNGCMGLFQKCPYAEEEDSWADAPPTAVKFTGVTSKEVANALWEAGSQREKVISWQNHDTKLARVWPSPRSINKSKAVFRYNIGHVITIRHRDTVSISKSGPDEVTASLKMEAKQDWIILFQIANPCPYQRFPHMEDEIISKTKDLVDKYKAEQRAADTP